MAKLAFSSYNKLLWVALLALSFACLSSGARILLESNRNSAVQSWEGISRKVEVQVSMDSDDLQEMESITFDGIDSNDDPITFTKTRTASRKTVDGGQEIVWHGALEGGGIGFATFVRSASGRLSGSFSNDQAAYSLVTFPDGSTHVKATEWRDFPDTDVEAEAPSAPAASLDEQGRLFAEASFCPEGRGHFTPVSVQHHETERVPSNRALRGGGQDILASASPHNRSLQGIIEVDVLVIVTNRAMCEYAGLAAGCDSTEANRAPMESAMSIAQEQTNEAMQGVGIPVETRFVEVIFLEGTFDGGPSTFTLDTLLFDQNVRQWRREAGADLVAMITGSGTGANRFTCGIAYLNTAVSATAYSCLQGYTLTHEVSTMTAAGQAVAVIARMDWLVSVCD